MCWRRSVLELAPAFAAARPQAACRAEVDAAGAGGLQSVLNRWITRWQWQTTNLSSPLVSSGSTDHPGAAVRERLRRAQRLHELRLPAREPGLRTDNLAAVRGNELGVLPLALHGLEIRRACIDNCIACWICSGGAAGRTSRMMTVTKNA